MGAKWGAKWGAMGANGGHFFPGAAGFGGPPKLSSCNSDTAYSYCRSVLEQDTEPLIAPGGVVGALHGFLCHRCMNG